MSVFDVEGFSIEGPLPYKLEEKVVSGVEVIGPHGTTSCCKVTIFHEDEIQGWWPLAVQNTVINMIRENRALNSRHWVERPPEPRLRTISFEEGESDEYKPGILKKLLAKAWEEGWRARNNWNVSIEKRNPYEE